MELTLNDNLRKGVEAYQVGQIHKADQCFTAILKAHPEHPDTNHNMGVLAVGIGKIREALPYFETALMGNSSIGQFWLSYIDALIKLNRIANARAVFDQAKDQGVNGVKFDLLGTRLGLGLEDRGVVFAVEEFYKKSKASNLSDAALGWFFTASFDSSFMEKQASNLEINKKDALFKDYISRELIEDYSSALNPRQTIDSLTNEVDIAKKFNKLKQLITSNDINLISDSFTGVLGCDFLYAQEQTFNTPGLNIVIIGAGVCGLFLASSIKFALGFRVNVLLLDNRSKQKNTREPFIREWLTHLPIDLFKKSSPPYVQTLLEYFGTNSLVGIPINLLEALLMLSCKDQGVQFYFSPTIDYSILNDEFVDLIFDATGGRLIECEYPATNSKELQVKIPKEVLDLKYAGVNQIYNIPKIEPDHLEVKLKPYGSYYYPYIGGSQIYTHMVKLVGIPQKLMQPTLDFIKPLNYLNLFYIWNGNLKKEVNEGLVLINLTNKEYDLLNSCIHSSIKLELCLDAHSNILKYLNKSIVSLFEMLVALDNSKKIKIENAFSYEPYININAGLGNLYGNRIFPVGDSLFSGNPKVGNGLGVHLNFINHLVEQIIKK